MDQRLVTVTAPREESPIYLSRHEWFLRLFDRAKTYFKDREIQPDDVEAVIMNTRDLSGLVKEMYAEFYCRDLPLMNKHLEVHHRFNTFKAQFLPSWAVQYDCAIFIVKDPL